MRFDRRECRLPPNSEIERQLRVNAPVILKISGEIRPLLADEADGVDAAVVNVPKQERGERIATPCGEIRIARKAGFLRRKRNATRDALPAETVVVIALVHAAGLERVLVLDPGQI